MDPTLFTIACGAFFFAAFSKGITGMGFEVALPLMLVPSVASNIIV